MSTAESAITPQSRETSLYGASRQPTEHLCPLSDGTQLFYRAWIPKCSTDKALILFHRGHEHSGRWQETVDSLGLDDVAIFAWDGRGHGRSPGTRGDAPDLPRVIRDADEFVRHISAQHGVSISNTIVLGHSVGAVIAAAWVHDYGPPIRALVLATPAFRVKLYVPLAIPALRAKQKFLGPGFVKSYVKASMLTHDREQAREYQADKLIFRQISVRMLLDLHDASTRLLADAGAIAVPTLVLAAGNDWVVQHSAQWQFYDRLSSPWKRWEFLPNFRHAVFHEKERQVVFEKVRDFILERFAQSPELTVLLHADRYGHTRREYDQLRMPGSWRWKALRLALKTFGRLSEGMRLGWEEGFDSGVMLDYVYENRPQGITPLGRLIDHNYLNSIGWRGIRIRRQHLEKLLDATIAATHASGQPVHILDIASGPGRYVLETIRRNPQIPITAHLRDYRRANLDIARRLAREAGLANVTLEQGDAFDRLAISAVSPKATIAVVSGLYELFPDNEPVLQSLHGVAAALQPGGHLIYTNQPWHPQVEFIARVLINREGQPWIMRRRSQAEMDELVRLAGFEKISQEIDAWGIFTVSVARRFAT